MRISLVFSLLALLVLPVSGMAQESTKQKVTDLVQKLAAEDEETRGNAQEALIALGSEALKFLPKASSSKLSEEQKTAVKAITTAIEKAENSKLVIGSTIKLQAKAITLKDVLAELQRQSGNQIIDMREAFGQPVNNPEMDLEWDGVPFWQAMDELREKGMVSAYLQTGEPYLGLTAAAGDFGSVPSPHVSYAGAVRVTARELIRRIVFGEPAARCTFAMELAWEPKLRPILIQLDPADLTVTDDKGRKIEMATTRPPGAPEDEPPQPLQMGVNKTMVSGNFVFDLSSPEYDARSIEEIRGKLEIVLPGKLESFRFKDLEKAKNQEQSSNSVKVAMDEFEDLGDGFWAANMTLEFEVGGDAFESYETWFYDNECYLVRADGTRFNENGGTTLLESVDGRVGLQYRFIDAPGKISDYRLVYRCPTTIARESVEFKFKGIELP